MRKVTKEKPKGKEKKRYKKQKVTKEKPGVKVTKE